MKTTNETLMATTIASIYTHLTALIDHASARATVEALTQQGITLTQEQKDQILETISASNARYLKRNPLKLDALDAR